jgi:2-polyprenyl-3-methyl-5-hydroxy-6-metoxy-1,4-benzoquinol methylase
VPPGAENNDARSKEHKKRFRLDNSMNLWKKFLKVNFALSHMFRIRNTSEYGPAIEYLRLAALLFSAPDIKHVIDVAAGSHWQFPLAYKDAYGLELSGVDIDADAMNRNDALDFRYEADVCNISIIGKGNYDLLTCHSGIEHFQNVQKFLDTAFLSLRPGGAVVAQFPSSLASFAIINKLLPQELKTKLLKGIYGSDNIDEIGYPAYYDKCRYSAFKRAAERSGFQVEYYLPTFPSSGYFEFLFPLFLLSQVLDIFRLVFGTKDMASYNVFVLRRHGDHFQIKWSWHSNF